jgi:hypothetical protein
MKNLAIVYPLDRQFLCALGSVDFHMPKRNRAKTIFYKGKKNY